MNLAPSDRIYDVLIVGAGPVGLATAIALRQRGINNILIVEQARSFRQVGQVVDILPNGLKALKCISEDAYQQIKTVGLGYIQARRQQSEVNNQQAVKKRFWYQKNTEGKVVRSTPLDFDFWYERYGEGRVSIPWYQLQTELRSLLPSATVKVNHRCVAITQDASYVTLNCASDREITANPFAHWENNTTEQNKQNININAVSNAVLPQPNPDHQFKAKLVVAADGINSTVRQLVYADSALSQWAKPEYSGFSAIACLQIEQVSHDIMQQLEEKYFQGDIVVTLRNDSLELKAQNLDSPRLILIKKGENSLGYLFHAAVNLEQLQHKSPEAIITLAADILHRANFPTIFAQVIKLSAPQAIIQRPYYIHPANIPEPSIWSNNRLVLVGDAAHGMPPFAAQGVNQGLADAAIIGTAIANIIHHNNLDNLEIIHQQFNQYEQLRRPLIEKVQEATMHNHSWSQEQWEKYSDAIYRHDVTSLCDEFILND
jgi:2-polyprenyl-6-methoxyphenol hydroxylase-like FAD-dependent oxidoreductase